MANIVGQARALERGYYPDDGTHCRIIEAGETFNLVEGLTKGSWFEVIEAKPTHVEVTLVLGSEPTAVAVEKTPVYKKWSFKE